ncbi:MAG: GDSL-type esterase/lipase family protein, partial [Spirochaetia bacterium]|nr:GDSL-type esterase/lipase family protein [Spirochaetia bacterium]
MAANTVIAPDTSAVSWSGRVDFTNPSAPRFDWPGVALSFNFTGTMAGVILQDEGRNDFNVFIDGRQKKNLVTTPGKKEYILAKGLPNGRHTAVIAKRTEGYDGMTVCTGIILGPKGKLLDAPVKPAGKILFIGDSLSVGYGVEGPGIKCENERKYKNNWLSFAAVAARRLNADFHIVAVSGRGVVRNYAEKEKKSARPMPSYFDNTLYGDDTVKWDHGSWIPDTVVINLGTNDFSTDPKPDRKNFINSYISLVKKVRKVYPSARIYCVTGPAQQEPFFTYMDEFFKKNRDKKVFRVEMSMLGESDRACDYHPNVKAAARMADELIAQMKENDNK